MSLTASGSYSGLLSLALWLDRCIKAYWVNYRSPAGLLVTAGSPSCFPSCWKVPKSEYCEGVDGWGLKKGLSVQGQWHVIRKKLVVACITTCANRPSLSSQGTRLQCRNGIVQYDHPYTLNILGSVPLQGLLGRRRGIRGWEFGKEKEEGGLQKG